jgi:hypothetical protein
MQFRSVLAILAAASATACAQMNPWREPDKIDPNVFPTEYKADMVRLARKSIDNPNDIRDGFISEPTLKAFGTENRYVVCVRFNEKGSDGRQVFPREKMAVYFGGDPNQFLDAAPDKCPTSAYKPFPELQTR